MLEDRLTSRFNQGLVTDVQLPDLETRIAILAQPLRREGDASRVPDDVLLLIADRLRNNVRDLEGCLVRLLAVASLRPPRHHHRARRGGDPPVVDPEPDHMSPEPDRERGGEPFLGPDRRAVRAAAHQDDRAASPGANVLASSAHRHVAGGNRTGVRRSRSHHRAVRLRQGRRSGGQ